DGSGCAFVMNKAVDDDTYQSNIYVQLFDEAKTVTPWTFGTNQNKSPRFSPDGEQMVFVSDRSGSNQLWLINTSGGEAEQLTTFKMAYLVHIGCQMEVKSFSWHDLNREQMSMNNMKRQKKRSKNIKPINKKKQFSLIDCNIRQKELD